VPRRADAAAEATLSQLAEAQAAYRSKHFTEALRLFDVVLSAVPRQPQARLGKAQVLADCGEDFEALELTESLLQDADASALSASDQVEALGLMGLLLHKKGLAELARSYLLEVRRRDPSHPILALLGQGGAGGGRD
jgi:chemotaxis protein methyltransferase WspC